MRRAILLTACLALVACGDAGIAPGARTTTPRDEVTPAGTATSSPVPTISPTTSSISPTPKPTPTHTGQTTTLTEEDSGSVVVLKVGDTVRVSLPSEYHQPDAQGSAVRRSAAAGGYPSGEPATATFVAVTKGTADLSSSTDYACLHATPSCALPQRLWSVRITVE